MAGAESSLWDKRPGESHFEWRGRVARLAAELRDRETPLVTPEAEQHGDYRDADVMHVETRTIAVTKRNATTSPLQAMHDRGGITAEQLEAAEQIEMAHGIITGGVSLRGASLEARVDNSGAARDVLVERMAMVRLEIIYARWRLHVPTPKRMFIEMITGTRSLVTVSRAYGVNWRRARKMFVKLLDAWIEIRESVMRNVDEDDVENAQKRVGGGRVI